MKTAREWTQHMYDNNTMIRGVEKNPYLSVEALIELVQADAIDAAYARGVEDSAKVAENHGEHTDCDGGTACWKTIAKEIRALSKKGETK